MASITMKGKGVIEDTATILHNAIMNSGMSVTLVDSSRHQVDETIVLLRVYDKFFYRANNRVSLSVQLIGSEDDIVVVAMGSGGGQGAIFRMDWGAEADFAQVIVSPLRKLGFEIQG